jgi:hypothetical protein
MKMRRINWFLNGVELFYIENNKIKNEKKYTFVINKRIIWIL